jgi:hypothetical protein
MNRITLISKGKMNHDWTSRRTSDAGQLSMKDFAHAFIKTYDIPQLAPSENQQFLTYRDADHGWEVDMYPDKSFKVYAVTTASQQAKNFN